MEEYSSKEDVHSLESQGDSDILLGNNITSDINDCSETSITNIPTNIIENEVMPSMENKTSESPDDFSISEQLKGTQLVTDDHLISNLLEVDPSDSNVLNKEPVNDQTQLSIELELEKIHCDVNETENAKIGIFSENDDKMDWTEDIQEASNVNIELAKEHLETEAEPTLQQVLERNDDSQSTFVEKSAEIQGEEQMEVMESTIQPSVSDIPKESELVSTVLIQSIGTELDKDVSQLETGHIDTSSENMEEDGILEESVEKEKAAAMESEVISIESDVISIGSHSISLDNQPISIGSRSISLENQPIDLDSRSISLENQSIDLDSRSISLENQPIDLESRPISLENQSIHIKSPSISLENQPIDLDSRSISLENQPIDLESRSISLQNQSIHIKSPSISLENQPIDLDSRSISLENQPIDLESRPISLENQSIHIKSPSISLENQPIDLDSRSISLENQPIDLESRPILLENQSIHLESRSISLENQSIDLDSRSISLENQSIDLDSRSISLENQPIDLESRSISLENQPIDLDTQSISEESQSNSLQSQSIPFIQPIAVEESRLASLETQAISEENHSVEIQSSISLEGLPVSTLEGLPVSTLEGQAVATLEGQTASTVEDQAVTTLETQAVSTSEGQTASTSGDQPLTILEGEDVSTLGQTASVDSISVSLASSPISIGRLSISSIGSLPISVGNQSTTTESSNISVERQSTSTESSTLSEERQSTSTESSTLSVEPQSTSTESPTLSVESQSLVTKSKPISVVSHSLLSVSSESQSSSIESPSTSGTSQTEVVSAEGSSESNAIEITASNSEELEKTCFATGATTSSSLEEKEKANDHQRENTEFVRVNTENEKDSEDNEKDDEANNRALMEHDPIGSDSFEPMNEDREGADAELCIIPDTEREISQAEKDAASVIPPLRDLSEASASAQSENNVEMITPDGGTSSIIIFKYEKEDMQICNECKLKRKVKYYYSSKNLTWYLCDDNCLNVFKATQDDKVAFNWEEGSLRVKNFTGTIKEPPSLSFIRKCASCKKVTNDIENNLTWEIMDFCNDFCLSKYQKEIGSHCSSCQGEVRSNSLGKYCVRFGNDIRQFCTSVCLEKYKKGLKVCSYCQQDMSGGPQGFLAPVGDKGQFKDFCSQLCMEKYDIMTNNRPPKVAPGTICSVCKAEKPITIEFELDGIPNYFCSEPCFVAFSFVNNISPGKCAMCRRHFTKATLEKHTMYYDNVQHSFCSNSCENIYIIAHRKIVPCSWCKVKKYNFDMIRRYSKTGPMINMCSVNCLSLYRVSVNAVNSRKTVCNFCLKLMHPMYHLTMSDATIRNFCTYSCVMGFQNQFPKQPITLNTLGESGFPVPTGAPKKNKKHPGPEPVPVSDALPLPIISSVQSLASTNGTISPGGVPPSLTPITTRSTRSKSTASNVQQILNSTPQIINSFADLPVQVQIKQHFIVRPAPMPAQRNVGTMCYTRKANKATTMKPIMVDEGMQTEEREASKILIPVPIPIYVPTPMHMFTTPTPVPVPFPVPVPVPILIPTTRNSAAGIMKEIKKIQVKIPTDPYEAELLMMAEMVAEEKKEEVTDSESDVDDVGGPEDNYSPEPVDASNTFGDDMLQMALKMATELDEPAVDLEGALTANTITAPQGGETHHAQEESVDDPQPMHPHLLERTPSVRGRKRGMRQSRGGAKRGRRMSHQQVEMPMMQHQVQQPPPPPEPTEKPDANMCLKYTFGVNAWKQWVTTKNTELEKSSRQAMLFKTEILQLTSDELNYSLCLFVKEVRKPNGAEYAPDTIYYLCLGIQQYLFENGRIDNIFCDAYYEKFTDCLDEVAKKFSVLYNDSHYIVTRVEEEHLWESKQLGAHSPHVLLSTLMFFNTKHFNLTTVDEHMQLSFSHIMKHWKRNPNQPVASKMPGLRNVLLRFYPPQSAIQNNTRKKKVYEQEQNEENPLRCPVKLYEFYLSKCPESVKTRNDVFYLQPERSCVPDSPVWYSTMPLPREALEKMLHRVKMVKEINVALLTS